MKPILLLADLCCFTSFGWAMLRHFDRSGKPSAGMIFTACLVPAFALLNVVALLTRPLSHSALGLVLYVIAAVVFWSAITATRGRGLAACFQGRPSSGIVRAGPYRAIRHPFYTAYTLVWIGGFAATGCWHLGAIAVFMASLYACAACKEEAGFLRSAFGVEYREYMRTTGRFLPRLGWQRS